MSGTLNSPGVEVTIIPESFYGSAYPGTIPLVIFATRANKASPVTSGTIAPYTAPNNAGILYYATSQREAIENFGYPTFTEVAGSVVLGDELNEWGLHAVYSYLGISSAAYLLRADIDLGQLEPSPTPPVGPPVNGTYWLNLALTNWGLFVSNGGSSPGSAWNPATVTVPQLAQTSSVTYYVGATYTYSSTGPVYASGGSSGVSFLEPSPSFGNVGDYAIVPWDVNNFLYQKISIPNGTGWNGSISTWGTGAAVATWVRVGSTYLAGMNPTEASLTWTAQFPNTVTTVNFASSTSINGTFTINGVSITLSGLTGASAIVTQINTTLAGASVPYIVASSVGGGAEIQIKNLYGTGLTFTDGIITTGTSILSLLGITNFFAESQALQNTVNTTYVDGPLLSSSQISGYVSGSSIIINGYEVTFSSGLTTTTEVANAINSALSTAAFNTPTVTVVASTNSRGGIRIANTTASGGYPGLIISDVGAGVAAAIMGIVTGHVHAYKVYRNSNATYPANSQNGELWVKGNPSNNGAAWNVQYYNGTTGTWTKLNAPFYQFNSKINDGVSGKDAAAISALGNVAVGTVYVAYDPVGDELTNGNISAGGVQQLRIFTNLTSGGTGWTQAVEVNPPYANYQTLEYEADSAAPNTTPADGTYWYDNGSNSIFADILVSSGDMWYGYKAYYPLTDSNGPIISASAPTQQVGGHMVGGSVYYTLVDNDIWINTDVANLPNYPLIYIWSSSSQSWNLVDNADQTSPNGIIFADARANSGPSYSNQPVSGYNYNSTITADMALSSYVDPDAPNPEEHPAGMLLFNTRYSNLNIKAFNSTYFLAYPPGGETTTNYTVTPYTKGIASFPPVTTAARWVSASGVNPTTNVPYFYSKAQRNLIVESLRSTVLTNQDILSELIYYNLIAIPGYIELAPDMVQLNENQKSVSFCIGDTPIGLPSDSQSILNWATNVANSASPDANGLAAIDPPSYIGLYYPWGLGQNYDGTEIMIPPSAMVLRVMAYNDQVAYPWYAPAGFTRGLVTNASSVGYLSSTGTFAPVILNQGQRDTLYENNINPIAYIPKRGLVVLGQKTLDNNTILNRVNVARLVNYIAYNLDLITKPYLFEPNTSYTQKAAYNTVSRFLNSLIGTSGIYDYAVVCDSTNNTPDRVNLNQLWIDVVIQPVESIEFIYIPVRVVQYGDSNSLNVSTTSTSNQ